MIRRSVGGAILGLSLLVGSFAWAGFVALQTVFDPDRSREVGEELLDNDEVRDQVEENLAFAISSIIPPEVPVEDGVVEQVTAGLLNNPEVEATLLDAFTDTHRAFLGEGDVPERVDLTPIAAAARQNLVAAAPQLDVVVPESPILSVPLPTERVPDAGPVRRFLDRVVPFLAGAALLGALVALIATSDRPSILRRAGTWALTTTVIYLILGVGVPYLLRQYAPEQAEVVAALLAALLRSLILPSAVLGGVGLALIAVSAMWPDRTRRPPRRAPDPDAPHHRQVAAMDAGRRSRPVDGRAPARAPAPGPAPVPARGMPRQPQRRSSPDPSPTTVQPGPTAAPVPPAPSSSPSPPPSPLPSPPPAPSPYPDEQHFRETHPREQWPGFEPGTGSAPGPAPAAAADPPPPTPSIFDDVPLPGSPPVAPGRSVFDDPAPADPSPAPPSSPAPVPEQVPERGHAAPSSPPIGARWSPHHGWILDPESPDPLPPGAVWVDGVGYVLPEPGRS